MRNSTINISVPPKVREKIFIEAEKRNQPVSRFIETAVLSFIATQQQRERRRR